MERTIRLFGIVAGVFAIFISMALFAYFGGFQGVLLENRLFSGASPMGIFAIFGILLFAGIYFFTAAGSMIKEAVK